MQFGPFC